MKCAVTGAAGFIGSHLCESLIEYGHTVIGIDNLSNGKLENLKSIKNNKNFHFIAGDIRNFQEKELIGTEIVFHLAALADIVPSIENPKKYHEANVDGTVAMLEASRKAKIKKFVYAASSSCYGIPDTYPTKEDARCDPKYPYALTKYIGEQYVRHYGSIYGMPFCSLRLFNVYGPRHRTSGAYGAVFGVFLSQLANKLPLTIVGDGTQKRDFTYITDVVDAFVTAGFNNPTGIYNIGSDKTRSINYLAHLLDAEEVVHLPKRPGEPDQTYADIRKFSKDFDWSPKVSFEDGVRKMKELIPEFKSAPLWTPEKITEATKLWFQFMEDK